MLKKTAIIIIIGLSHFALCIGIVPVTMAVAAGNTAELQGPSTLFRVLAVVTKILYWPIISLAWYPRSWFPGEWVNIPILINSLLWGTGIYVFLFFARKTKKHIQRI
jgi:hypothetical protein